MNTSRRTFLLGTAVLAWARDGITEGTGAVDQRSLGHSENGCGPTAVLNLLKFSRPDLLAVYENLVGGDSGTKLRFFVDRYLRDRDSVVYPGQDRWGVHGVATADLLIALNELLADGASPELKGCYLDRNEEESHAEHLQRCHRWMRKSLEREVSPILSLRSFFVKHREENDHVPGWGTGRHHNVTLIGVPEETSDAGFQVEAIDPWKGKEITLFLYREGMQAFRALKGVEPTGAWLRGMPFLLAVAPEVSSLIPGNLEWSDRLIVTANFLIGDF